MSSDWNGAGGKPHSPALGASVLEIWQPAPHDVTSENTWSLTPINKGDSGAPLFVLMPDGTYRVVGVGMATVNYYHIDPPQRYHNFVYYQPLPVYLRWIEQESGRDITPCHTWTSQQGWTWNGTCSPSTSYHGDSTPNAKTWGDGCYDLGSTVVPTACGGAPMNEIQPPPVLTWAGSSESELDWIIEEYVYGRSEGVLFPVPRVDELIGSPDADVIFGTLGDDVIRGGAGDDDLDGARGRDAIFGGSGDDLIFGGAGNDRIYPGPGADAVYGEGGDDVVVVFDACEVEAGELLDGGPGHDVLLTGAPLRQLVEDLGAMVQGFEEVIHVPELSQYATCNMVPGRVPNFGASATAPKKSAGWVEQVHATLTQSWLVSWRSAR